jgi:hypothetical protein
VRRVVPVATFFAVTSVSAGAFPRNVASADWDQETLGAASTAATAAPISERGKFRIGEPS